MITFKHILIGSSLTLFSVTAQAATTYGAYANGSDLEPYGYASDGGAGFSTAAVNSATFGSMATIGGATYTPILKAWSTSKDAPVDDDITQSEATAFQVYTSTITQTITLDLSLHGIALLDGTPLSLSQILANVEIRGGDNFAVSDTYCAGGRYVYSTYLCGSKLGFKQLYIDSGEQTLFGTLSFNVMAGEQFSVFASLDANSRDGSADAYNTFITTFVDDTYIQANIGTVPVPAAAWLFGSGLIALVGVSRRKK